MTQLPEDELAVLPDLVKAPFSDVHDDRRFTLLEFGNKKNSTGTYREWYESHGCTQYVSIDWNGKDGALPIDVNFPMVEEWKYPFDIVTNYGFSEHVTNQYMFWLNNHNVCEIDGFMVGVTPAPEQNHWPHHGILQPTIEFYEALAELNGYIVNAVWQNQNRKRFTNCYSWRRPNEDPFRWDDQLLDLITPTQDPTLRALKNSGL